MVKIELNDRLKVIKHQMKILQASDDNNVFDQALGSLFHSNQITKMTIHEDFELKHQVKIFCKLRNLCKVIALVHLGYYHLSCIICNSVFKTKNCISFENLSSSIKP